LVGRVEVIDLDYQFPAQVVQQDFGHLLPRLGRCCDQRRVGVLPYVRRCADIGQRFVLDFQQAALLEIRRSDSPSPFQVAVQSIAQHVAERPLGVRQRLETGVGIAAVVVFVQAKLVEDAVGEFVVLQTGGPGGLGGSVQSTTQDADLDEVIEVTGLE